MRWHVSVNVNTRLRVRTGPGLSYRIVDYKYNGNTGIVVDSKTSGGLTWYKWEGTNYWSCAIENGSKYLNKIYDLEPKPTPSPAPEPTPPSKDPIDVTRPQTQVDPGSGRNVENTTKFSPNQDDWYIPMTFSTGSYNPVDDDIIAKNIAALKHNMDISYSTKDDVYDGYLSDSSKGYFSDLQKKLYNSFNRNKTAFPDKELTKTFAYVFFTRPDLNILERESGTTNFKLASQMDLDKKYSYLWNNNPWCLKSLVSAGNPYHKFMVLLSNEAQSFEVGDVVLKTTEHGETYNGNKIIYGKSDQESNAAGEMSIRYVDSVNLDIFKLHVAWVDYINKVSRGIIEPKREYMTGKILDYAASCYYILCGPDGSTILYWQKLTGVFPINTGENTFSWDSGTLLAKPQIDIKYMYSFKSSMDPRTLIEFDSLSSTSKKQKKMLDDKGAYIKGKYYEGDYGIQTGSTLTHAPRILDTEDTEGNKIFRLIWVEN
jgi:hypothetical protein